MTYLSRLKLQLSPLPPSPHLPTLKDEQKHFHKGVTVFSEKWLEGREVELGRGGGGEGEGEGETLTETLYTLRETQSVNLKTHCLASRNKLCMYTKFSSYLHS